MLNGLFRHKKTINLIIKDHVLRFVDLKSTEPLVVKSHYEQYLPEGIIKDGRIVDEEKLTNTLEQCVGQLRLKGRHVRFVVPDQSIIIRKQLVPSDVEDDEIKGFLYMELGTSIHLPFENPVFDFEVIGRREKKKEILLFAAPEELVVSYSTLLNEVNLKPVAADISPLCMYRLFYEKGLTKREHHYLAIQFDLQTVNVSIFHDDHPVFMRHLEMDVDLSGMSLNGVMKWNGDQEIMHGQIDDIFVEIARIINYYRYSLNQDKAQITHAILTGDQPEMKYVSAQIKERFDLPVIEYVAEDIHTVNDQSLPPSFHLAVGLALKEVR